MTFLVLAVINFIGMVECKKEDEKQWLFALAMSVAGFLITALKLIYEYQALMGE